MFPFFDRNVWIVTLFFHCKQFFAIALYESSANIDNA